METLSLGQATREKPQPIPNARKFLARPLARPSADAEPTRVLFCEIALAGSSYGIAVLLFVQQHGILWAVEVLRSTLFFAVAFRLAATMVAGIYCRSLRHSSALDLIAIAKAATLSGVSLTVFILWRFRELDVPVAVFVVDTLLLIVFWGALHAGGRILQTRRAAKRREGKRTLIVGAGDAGMAILKELALDPASPCLPVGVVDDDPAKWGRSQFGVPVLGGTKTLAKIAVDAAADEVLICIPSATHSQMHDILDASRRSNLPVRSLPSLAEIIRGTESAHVSRRDLRSPRIEDLLQRDQIEIDVERTRQVVEGKTVLVTGAGGSIGSELCRQVADANPRKLVLIDKAENSLFYANLECGQRLGPARVKPCLVDIVSRDRIQKLMLAEQPDIVFHAAAHKHVAMLELHPEEAIRNNVFGTRNLAEAALAAGVGRFVNISTDKAVDPQNYMGLSKKLTELCIQEIAGVAATGRTRFSNVRFGNVAGSTGSVLKLFWQQIQAGGPIRVTDPRATRYFMSVPEAVHLILRAAALGRGSETFVLDMGEPLNIYELAKTVTLFAGLKPEVDIAIEFTGLLESEKIAESLWEDGEHPVASASDHIFEIRDRNPSAHHIFAKIARMEQFLEANQTQELLEYLGSLFPRFRRCRQSIPASGAATTATLEAA